MIGSTGDKRITDKLTTAKAVCEAVIESRDSVGLRYNIKDHTHDNQYLIQITRYTLSANKSRYS